MFQYAKYQTEKYFIAFKQNSVHGELRKCHAIVLNNCLDSGISGGILGLIPLIWLYALK